MHELIKKQLKKHKLSITAFIVIYIVDIMLLLIEPVIFGKILDLILENSGVIINETIKNIIILISLLVLTFILHFIYRRIIFASARKMKQGVIVDILEKLEKADIKFFEETDKGTFISYIINDIQELWVIFSHGFIEIVRLVAVTIIGFIIAMTYVDFALSVSVFITFPIFIYFVMKQNFKAQSLLKQIKDLEADLSKKINDGFCGFSVIKSYVKEEETIEEFSKINNNIKNKNIEYKKILASINGIVTFCTGLSFSISLVFGIFLVFQNQITIGSFIAFNSIIQKIMKDYIYAGNLAAKYNQIKIINKRIDKLYYMDINEEGNIKIPENADIHIQNLSFKYKNEDENILENVNLDIPSGFFIGILGKTGSGKTTLTNILTKFYKVENGTIYFNDIDINNINRKSFYNNVSYVLQEDYVYDNTIRHNVELYKDYGQEDVDNALEKAEFLDTVENLENKHETRIGESGIKLSGGQKQRLVLARNIITNPQILIIDNGITGLDLDTRKRVIEKITNKNDKTTLIIISSMIEDIKDADKIYVLEDKTIKQINPLEVENA